MTSKELRTLMSTELDRLAPMPDLVPQVIRQGATQVRRRRLAAGGLVAAAAIGGMAIAPWASGRSQSSDSQPADGGGSSAVPSDVPTPSPMSAGLVLSDPEVMAAFDAALPDRFSPVEFRRSHPQFPGAGELLTTNDGQAPLFVDVVLRAHGGKHVCADHLTCQQRNVDGGQATASREAGRPDSARAILVRDSWSTTVSVFTEPGTEAVPITDQELLNLLAHPNFLAMIDAQEPTTNPTDVPPADAIPTVAPPEPSDAPPAPTASPTPSDQPTTPPTSDSATPTPAPTPSAVPNSK